MILLDTNIFIIDRFFPRDERYSINRQLIARMGDAEFGFSIFSLLELCGLASFNLLPEEFNRWCYNFDEVYAVEILNPAGIYTVLADEWFEYFSHALFDLLRRKMTWGDATLLATAEEYAVEAIVTWNKKHFEDRTTLKVLTPAEYVGA